MTKDKDKQIRELERKNSRLRSLLAICGFVTLVFVVSYVILGITDDIRFNKIEKQLSECQLRESLVMYCDGSKCIFPEKCQEQVYCGNTFRNSMSDSCVIGCIYSTKFYYNNPKVDFEEASYDCMLNCIETARDIQGKFSFCEVIK